MRRVAKRLGVGTMFAVHLSPGPGRVAASVDGIEVLIQQRGR